MLCTPERNAFGTSLRTTPPNEWSPFEVRRVVPRTFLSIVFADFGKSLVIVVRHVFSVVRTGPRTKLFNRLPVRVTVLLVEESKLRSRFGIDFVNVLLHALSVGRTARFTKPCNRLSVCRSVLLVDLLNECRRRGITFENDLPHALFSLPRCVTRRRLKSLPIFLADLPTASCMSYVTVFQRFAPLTKPCNRSFRLSPNEKPPRRPGHLPKPLSRPEPLSRVVSTSGDGVYVEDRKSTRLNSSHVA